MKNNALAGTHCQALWNIITVQGLILQGTRGTIREEFIGPLHQRKVRVEWENDLITVVALSDVNIVDRGE